jgi:hypothetical protein
MTPGEKRDIQTDLFNKVVAYWHDVDFNWGRNAGAYYTEDAIFESSMGDADSYVGRKQIEAFYAFRVARGPRVNVHSVTNFHCEFKSDTEVLTSWLCFIHAHDGEAPQVAAAPINISLVKDVTVLETGEWLVKRRTWHPLFRGGVPATRPSLAEMAQTKQAG